MLPGCLATAVSLVNIKPFFEPKLSAAFERSYNQGLEMLEWQSAWKKRDLKEVKAYFATQAAQLKD